MTPVEIAYFKHFLFDCGIQAIYISMYKKNRIKGGPEGDNGGNPESLEQFLQEQPPSRALMNAFYFQPNSEYGYDYWNDLNEKWEKYLGLHADNPRNTKVVVLKGTFAILRQNWDRPQYWKTETMEATYARMHMEPPLKGVDLEKAFNIPRVTKIGEHWADEKKHKFNVGDIIEGSISGEILTITAVKSNCYETNDGGIIDFDKEIYWTKVGEIATEEIEDVDFEDNNTDDFSRISEADANKQDSILDGFSLVETNNSYGGKRMGNSTVSVNLRNGGYKITFAAKQSNALRKIDYKYVKLLTKKETGEIALVFNCNSGCAVKTKDTSDKHRNITINSKEIVEHITKFYGIKSPINYFTLVIVDTIRNNMDTIYKLKLSE